jgi:spoIIIJ-associated protein
MPSPVHLGVDDDGEPKLPMAPAPKFEGMNVVVHTPAHAAPPVDEPVAAAPVAEPEAEAAPRAERSERRDRRDRGDRPAREERAPREPREPRPEGSSSPEMSSEELGATSKQITEELLRKMGFDPKVEVRTEGNRVDVTIEVERDDHLLNGRGGETRLALQHILNRFLNKGDGSRYHLQLEVNDFWEQRENELADIARQLAEQAVTANAEVVGEPMNSMERRIVHMTLREDSRVKTYSLGDGAVKRVAVAPAGLAGGADDSHAG